MFLAIRTSLSFVFFFRFSFVVFILHYLFLFVNILF